MKQSNGFTLVEMLVALVLGALLMAFVSWSVAGLARQLRPSPSTGAADVVEIGERLQAMIAGMELPARDVGFDGTARGFSSIVSAPDAAGSPARVRMSLVPRGGTPSVALVARFEALEGEAPWPARAREIVLMDKLKRVQFDYDWRTPSQGLPDRLPQSIVVTLTPLRGDEHRLVLQPKVTTDGSCRFDPISQTCRP